jgi:hypothetical protein
MIYATKPFWIEGFAGLQDSKSDMDELAHGSAGDGFAVLAIGFQTRTEGADGRGLYCQATSVGCIPCTTNGITNWVLVCEMEMVRETHPTQMRKSMPDYGTLRHFGNVRF